MKGVKQSVFVLKSEELIEGEPQDVVVNGNVVLVARIGGEIYAVEGICTHAYAELIDGDLDEHCLVCPLHFACFDIRNGIVLEGPANVPLTTYEVEERDGKIWINE
ncbi:Rieske 2Fe-2S domain-containing protein [Oceanobacillus sp. FSL K6-2867]|uniref:Rieske (2Fe-2S) protein n=1 Tax=Oceanobacillus sp. FSL K6-2867 TaxID=2954748 RepID=UPI0030DBCD31